MRLELDEVRRLTGPNLLWEHPGAIVDVFINGVDKHTVAHCWQRWTQKILKEFGWLQDTTFRIHEQGGNFALSAPMDALYCACDLAELAWECCVAETTEKALPNWQERLQTLQVNLAEERNPELIALISAANEHHVSCISDDDDVSLGMGKNAKVFPVRSLPEPNTIDWTQFHDIPRAFITGTNGKSTSVRLAANIAKAAGIVAGVTSTDFIRVGEDIIDEGDYSGPGGARMLLRDTRTEMAFLEVARGGILRRGIPIESVDAALITNVASDHLGQYGINTVGALAETKFVVSKGLDQQGTLVLNADNDWVVNLGQELDVNLCWFSQNEDHPLIQQHLAESKKAVFMRGQEMIYANEHHQHCVANLAQIPMTLNGAAGHNVQNALGVVGLCHALNLPIEAIRQGLAEFGSNAADNPGRGNVYHINNVKVMVDFAHNEHSMQAVVKTVNQLPAAGKIAMFSHAGDRTDEEIQSLSKAVMGLQANCYIVAELERYLRGRDVGDIPRVVSEYLQTNGVAKQQIKQVDTPLEGAKYALSCAKPGDVVLLFVLADREQVHHYLHTLEQQSANA